MAVGTYALTSLDEALAYIGENVSRDAFWIYYNGANSTATVEVQENKLVLTDSSTTEIDLTNASYDTLGELVTYINNSVTDWVAGLIYHSSASSADLIVTGELNAKGSSNEQTLKIKDNYLIERLIDRASDLIERYCGRKLKSRSYTKEVYDGTGTERLILREYPVTQVSRVAIGRADAFSVKNTTATTSAFVEVTDTKVILTADGSATELTISNYSTINDLITAIKNESGWTCSLVDSNFGSYQASEILVRPAMYCLDPDVAYIEIPDDYITDYFLKGGADEFYNPGILHYYGGFNAGHQNVFVWYTAGYTTIPYALEQACLELVKYKYDQSKRDSGVKSEKIGKVYSYTLADLENALPNELLSQLQLFKRVDI